MAKKQPKQTATKQNNKVKKDKRAGQQSKTQISRKPF